MKAWSDRYRKAAPFMLALALTFLYFLQLGQASLWDIDEGVYSEIAREMVESRDWISTSFNYAPRFDKPPFSLWVDAAFFSLFGLSEWALRLGATLFALAGLGLAYLWGRTLLNSHRGGFLTALILGTSLEYFLLARFGTMDTTLSFFLALALWFFWKGWQEKKPGWYLWMWLALSAGTLTKGPVALILAGAVIFFFLGPRKFCAEWRHRETWWGLLAYLATALPWYLIMGLRYGEPFWRDLFGYHMFLRFTTSLETHGGPWYFYLVVLFLGFLPWSACLPSIARQWRRWGSATSWRFLVLWAGIIFLFFTVSRTKLPNYILPAFYPLALLAAEWWDALWTKKDEAALHQARRYGLAVWLLLLLAAGLMAGLLLAARRLVPPEYFSGYLLLWRIPLAALAATLAGLLLFLWRPRPQTLFWTQWTLFALLYALFVIALLPGVEEFKPVRPLALAARPLLQSGDRVGSALMDASTPFYIRHRVEYLAPQPEQVERFLRSPERVFLLAREQDLRPIDAPYHVLQRHHQSVLVTNRPLGRDEPGGPAQE